MRFCLEVAICFAVTFNGACSAIREVKEAYQPAVEVGLNLDSKEDILNHERYARHVQMVTESVVEHIVKQLRTRYPDMNKRMPKQKLSRISEDIAKMIHIIKHKKKNDHKEKNKKRRKKGKQKRKEEVANNKSSLYSKNKLKFMNDHEA